MPNPNFKLNIKFRGEKEYSYFLASMGIINKIRKDAKYPEISAKEYAVECCMAYAQQVFIEAKRARDRAEEATRSAAPVQQEETEG